MKPVTVLITTLNSARFITDAVQSILLQTFQDFELLIVDGGSSDSTVQKIKTFSDPRIRLSVCPGMRRSEQLNYGLSQITSPYIALMDSDDIALPERLATEYQFLIEHPKISIVGSWAELVNEDTMFLGILKKPLHHTDIINRLTINAFPSFGSIVFRKDLLVHNVFFNESLKSAEDYEWYIRISKYATMENIPIPLMKFRQTHSSLSRVRILENNAVLIESIDAYFKSCSKEDLRPIKRLHGIVHYYYGSTHQAKSLLLDSLRKEGVTLLTLRYLLPLLVLSDQYFQKSRTSTAFRRLAHIFRRLESHR